VINNLEVTNSLDIQPEVRCRVLLMSTLESFTIGHTIVLSRGLIDVLPDEGSLAAILAHELGHVVLGHRMDTQFAFFDSVRFKEKETFRHFDFARTPGEEEAAKQKGIELLNNSPYKEQSGAAQLFLQALKNRTKEIPNLISPHLGDSVSTSLTIAPQPSGAEMKPAPANGIAALPLGGRIKLDPWNDQLRMLKSKPAGTLAESERMPFEVTPVALYLTRQGEHTPGEAPNAVAAKADPETKP
jgi:peptidase M48-like protein